MLRVVIKWLKIHFTSRNKMVIFISTSRNKMVIFIYLSYYLTSTGTNSSIDLATKVNFCLTVGVLL